MIEVYLKVVTCGPEGVGILMFCKAISNKQFKCKQQLRSDLDELLIKPGICVLHTCLLAS